MSTKRRPTWDQEDRLSAQGYTCIAGVDEAGCGALAGPVVAGAAVLERSQVIDGLRDSKMISENVRERMYEEVAACARAWGVGVVHVEEIEEIGIRPATYLAMRRALAQVAQADFALVDAWTVPELSLPQQGIVRGDQIVMSISAAAIIAKVTRDRMMRAKAEAYPVYGFDGHKGYGTAKHRAAIKQHGPCPLHRRSFLTRIH